MFLFNKKKELSFISDESRNESRTQVLGFIKVMTKPGCLEEDLLNNFFEKFSKLDVSMDKFKSVTLKIENDELEKITKEEHKTLNLYFAVLLYYLEDKAKKKQNPSIIEILNMLNTFTYFNETLKQLDKKYCEFPTAKEGQYLDDAYGLFFTNFNALLELGISPEQYATIDVTELLNGNIEVKNDEKNNN